MVSTSISARPIPKVDWSGSLRWTDWRLCDQKQWSQGTRSRKMMTTRASSTKPGDINRLNAKTSTARELYDAMLQIYPDRANPGSLWGGANKAKELAQAAK